MVSLACSVSQEDGVTLVTGQVRNPDRPRRVRLEHRLDGPVWPPRSEGVPAAGWDEDGFECVLAADETRAFGYATPADPADEPLVVAETEPVEERTLREDASQQAVPEVENSPGGIIRTLGSPRPPRDAVPTPDVDQHDAEQADAEQADADRAGGPVGNVADAVAGEERVPDVDAVESWLAAVERRVDAGETLTPDASVEAATAAVERVGGLGGVRELDGQLADDAARLRTIAARAERLAARAEQVEVPVDTIERLV